MTHSKLLAALFWVLVLGGCGREAAESENAGQSAHSAVSEGREVIVFGADLRFDDIKEKLRGNDPKQMADAIVQMVTMQQRAEVTELLLQAWSNTRDKHPELNWRVIRQPRVCVALAQVLGQWYRDDPQYRAYILAELEKAEGVEKTDTLIALGAVATARDIEYLERTGKDADEATAGGALAALQIAGGRSAIQALERIKNDPSISAQRKELVTQLLGLPRLPRQ